MQVRSAGIRERVSAEFLALFQVSPECKGGVTEREVSVVNKNQHHMHVYF